MRAGGKDPNSSDNDEFEDEDEGDGFLRDGECAVHIAGVI
jgi:hypothetical protein